MRTDGARRNSRVLTDEAQDDSRYLTPSKPSEAAALTDEEIIRLYRKIAFANKHPFSAILEYEMRARLIKALQGFQAASEQASRRLELLTWTLVALTVVIALFTVALFLRE